ncbi:GNAT family N-acetyltransferase [Kordiimonas aquimaris]|uniref:GNAT family N-acetyltransferase n=1 Tax=Kordiimonas aquimaris TaxID=707591 RepID=UPI0021D0AFF7|nr:GNAT family N-acetyltransferase [Kordiimonas aquimaris]
MTHLNFRKAARADVAMLIDFIRALASHERRPEAATVTDASLEQLLFGESKLADAYIGFVDEKAAAFAVVAQRFSSFKGERSLYLEDMLIVDDYRGQGLGTQLFAFVADLAVSGGYSGLNWSALDDNDVAIGFYNHIKAEEETGVLHFSMDAEKLQQYLENM